MNIEAAFDVQSFAKIVHRRAGSELIEKPEALLRERERGRPGALATRNGQVAGGTLSQALQTLLQQQLLSR